MIRAHMLTAMVLLAAAAAGIGATPGAVSAADCGADYMACLAGSSAATSSDPLHERDCWDGYWQCVSQRMLLY